MKNLIVNYSLAIISAIAIVCVASFGCVGLIEMPVIGHLLLFMMSFVTATICLSLFIWRNRNISE